MNHLFTYWYKQSPGFFYASLKQTIASLDGTFAVASTIHNLGKPIFQDYTLQGRMIGFVLRLFRIGAGIFAFFMVGVVYALAYLVWLFFPLICLVSLIGSFAASSGGSL